MSDLVGDEAGTGALLVPGREIAGRYALLEPIGAGGVGSVWAARHLSLGHRVALKFLHSDRPITAALRTRFEREAQLCAMLGERSRHIVRVMEHGQLDAPSARPRTCRPSSSWPPTSIIEPISGGSPS